MLHLIYQIDAVDDIILPFKLQVEMKKHPEKFARHLISFEEFNGEKILSHTTILELHNSLPILKQGTCFIRIPVLAMVLIETADFSKFIDYYQEDAKKAKAVFGFLKKKIYHDTKRFDQRMIATVKPSVRKHLYNDPLAFTNWAIHSRWNQRFCTPYFIKPTADTKAFKAGVLKDRSIAQYIEANQLVKAVKCHSNNVLLAELKDDRDSEYRIIVMEGKIITASQYMKGRRIIQKSCNDPTLLDFARKMIAIYQPSAQFALDIVKLRSGELKIMEYNALCCSALYACNIQSILNHLIGYQNGK